MGEGQKPRAVLLLHGLHGRQEGAFENLQKIEQKLLQAGVEESARFNWPAAYNPVANLRIIPNSGRSFFGELAKELDTFLCGEFAEKHSNSEWFVVAYSAGGGIWYRWLNDFGQRYLQRSHNLPTCVFTLASPYTWLLGQRLRLSDTIEILIDGEENLDSEALVTTLPGRLVAISAENDDTLLPENTVFPKRLVNKNDFDQHEIENTNHNSVCESDLTIEVIRFHLRDMNILP